MRKLILIVLMIGISVSVQAQDVQRFFKVLTSNYADQDGFSASMLSSDMFDLYLKKKDFDENSEVAAALKNLDNILVVSQSKFGEAYMAFNEQAKNENTAKPDYEKLHKEILAHYEGSDYTLLKTEKRMGEDIKVYLQKKNGGISSLALVTNSNTATSLVELDGDIDLSNVASLSKAMNLRGLENLYKLDNKGAYYGARVPYIDEERIEEMAARAREMAERQAELTDEQMQKIQEQAEMQAQKQMEMAEKYREMSEKYGRQPIFLNYPGDSTVYYLDGKKVDTEKIKELINDDIKTIDVSKDLENGDITIVRITTK